MDDVVLEVDGAPRRPDRFQPRGVVLRGVAQEAHGIPAHQGRSRGPREELVAEATDCLKVGHGVSPQGNEAITVPGAVLHPQMRAL